MWSRVIILALGLWLAISAFVLPEASEWWLLFDVGEGLAVMLLAAASLTCRKRVFDLLIVLAGCLLIGAAYADFGDPPPAAQNRAVTGLLLMMLASVPAPQQTSKTKGVQNDVSRSNEFVNGLSRTGGGSVSYCGRQQSLLHSQSRRNSRL